MQTSISFLVYRRNPKHALSLRPFRIWKQYCGASIFAIFGFLLCPYIAGAYTVVTISTAAPQGIENQLIAATTTQFSAKVTPNPFAANTFAVTIYGKNPNYDAPPSYKEVVEQSYPYGWAAGLEYQNHVDENIASGFAVNCSTPSAFILQQTTTTTFDRSTCQDVLNTLISNFYELNLSTPPVLGAGGD